MSLSSTDSSVRRALVVGNQNYLHSPLLNSRRDAQDLAARLKELGFAVTLVLDADLKTMAKAVDAYADSVQPPDISFFYYSGHGIQVSNENYLVPVDFAALKEEDAPYAGYAVGRLMQRLEKRSPALSVVVLDACRDNPYLKHRGGGGGLVGVDAARGTLVAFATSPGSTAADGAPGGNGLYTGALLKRLGEADVDIETAFKRVREDVNAASNGRQVPWSMSSVIGNFCLVGESCGSSPLLAARPAAVVQQSRVAVAEPVVPRSVASKTEKKSRGVYLKVPGGSLHIGCEPSDHDCYSDEKPGLEVSVAPFWLGRTEVTVGEYAKCVEAKACTTAGNAKHCNVGVAGRETHPINCVDARQADSFCHWVKGRLPTTAEWEFAAKSGGARVYPWGSAVPTTARARYKPADGTGAVGSLPDGADVFGILDLAGNVREWTAAVEGSNDRDVRGGGFDSFPRLLRASARKQVSAEEIAPDIGFRCALDR